MIHAIASERLADGTIKQYHLRLPKYNTHVVGTGDTLSAVLFALIIKGKSLKEAFESAYVVAFSLCLFCHLSYLSASYDDIIIPT